MWLGLNIIACVRNIAIEYNIHQFARGQSHVLGLSVFLSHSLFHHSVIIVHFRSFSVHKCHAIRIYARQINTHVSNGSSRAIARQTESAQLVRLRATNVCGATTTPRHSSNGIPPLQLLSVARHNAAQRRRRCNANAQSYRTPYASICIYAWRNGNKVEFFFLRRLAIELMR